MKIEELIKNFNVEMHYEINDDETKVILCEIKGYDIDDWYWEEKGECMNMNFSLLPIADNWDEGLDEDSIHDICAEMHNYEWGKMQDELVRK
jgi:hypothetical protein